MRHLVFGKPKNGSIQFFRYLFVGGSSALVDLALYAVFLKNFGMHYLMAGFIAYVFGFFWNYLWGLLWVFWSKHTRFKEFVLVFSITLGGLFWTELLLYLGVDLFRLDPFLWKVAVLWIVLLWNFGMRKIYVFH